MHKIFQSLIFVVSFAVTSSFHTSMVVVSLFHYIPFAFFETNLKQIALKPIVL